MAMGLAMLHGHDPRDVREWPFADLDLLLRTHTHLYGGDE